MVARDRRRAPLPGVIRGGALVPRDPRRVGEQRGELGPSRGGIPGSGGRDALRHPRGPAQLAVLAGLQLHAPAEADGRTRVGAVERRRIDALDDGRWLRELEMRQSLAPVQTVVPERDAPVGHGDRQQPAATLARVAPDLEDVGAVGAELELDRDLERSRRVVDDPQHLDRALGRHEALPADADRAPHQLIERVHLRIGVAVRRRVRHLDPAAVVRPDRGLEQDRSLAADPEDRTGQEAAVAAIQAQSARVGVDVAERIGQQVDVGVLEDLHRAEVGRPRHRLHPGRQEADLGGVRRRHRHRSGSRGGRPGRPSGARRSGRRDRRRARPAGCGRSSRCGGR